MLFSNSFMTKKNVYTICSWDHIYCTVEKQHWIKYTTIQDFRVYYYLPGKIMPILYIEILHESLFSRWELWIQKLLDLNSSQIWSNSNCPSIKLLDQFKCSFSVWVGFPFFVRRLMAVRKFNMISTDCFLSIEDELAEIFLIAWKKVR